MKIKTNSYNPANDEVRAKDVLETSPRPSHAQGARGWTFPSL